MVSCFMGDRRETYYSPCHKNHLDLSTTHLGREVMEERAHNGENIIGYEPTRLGGRSWNTQGVPRIPVTCVRMPEPGMQRSSTH